MTSRCPRFFDFELLLEDFDLKLKLSPLEMFKVFDFEFSSFVALMTSLEFLVLKTFLLF